MRVRKSGPTGGWRPRSLLYGLVLACVAAVTAARASPDRLIEPSGVGPVQLGMTIAAARATLAGLTLVESSNGDGSPRFAVRRGETPVMQIYADEAAAPAAGVAAATIVAIEVSDPAYRTAAGVGPQSPLGEVERAYGPLIRVRRSDVERREDAEFAAQPPGLLFRVDGGADGGEAGIYLPGTDMTDRVRPDARIRSIIVQQLP